MDFDIDALTQKINRIKTTSHELDVEDNIKKYGTFLDSKKDIVQLYLLFIFFGINSDIIQMMNNYPHDITLTDYGPD